MDPNQYFLKETIKLIKLKRLYLFHKWSLNKNTILIRPLSRSSCVLGNWEVFAPTNQVFPSSQNILPAELWAWASLPRYRVVHTWRADRCPESHGEDGQKPQCWQTLALGQACRWQVVCGRGWQITRGDMPGLLLVTPSRGWWMVAALPCDHYLLYPACHIP